MPAVKTCPLDPSDLVQRFRQVAADQGFREEPLGVVDDVPLLAFTKRSTGVKPRIYISSGVHGDEPAPPQALLSLLEEGVFDDHAQWFLVPMLNPSGFRSDQRENSTGVDLNRDYLTRGAPETQAHVRWLLRQPRFDLALCLHEDWEASGFYLYELLRDGSDETRAQALRDAAAAHLPIQPGEVIDGRPISEPGIIRPESDPALRDQWPEAIYLFAHHTNACYTFESPTPSRLQLRILSQCAAVKKALQQVLN